MLSVTLDTDEIDGRDGFSLGADCYVEDLMNQEVARRSLADDPKVVDARGHVGIRQLLGRTSATINLARGLPETTHSLRLFQ